jgi:hypothetical protein
MVGSLLSCARDPPPAPRGRVFEQASQCFPQSISAELDLLIVIDRSPSMAGEAARFGAQLDAIVESLAALPFGFPDAPSAP